MWVDGDESGNTCDCVSCHFRYFHITLLLVGVGITGAQNVINARKSGNPFPK